MIPRRFNIEVSLSSRLSSAIFNEDATRHPSFKPSSDDCEIRAVSRVP
jgi:hypothetical protein